MCSSADLYIYMIYIARARCARAYIYIYTYMYIDYSTVHVGGKIGLLGWRGGLFEPMGGYVFPFSVAPEVIVSVRVCNHTSWQRYFSL